MARLPGLIQEERFSPGQFPRVSEARAVISGIETGATAIQQFDRAMRNDWLIVQREKAATELDRRLSDEVTRVRQNPGEIEGIVEGFDTRTRDVVEGLSDTLLSEREQAIFRARGSRAINQARNELVGIQSERQIADHRLGLDNRLDAALTFAVSTGQSEDDYAATISEGLNEAVATGRELPAWRDAKFDTAMRGYQVAQIEGLRDAENPAGILRGVRENRWSYLNAEDIIEIRREAKTQLQALNEGKIISLMNDATPEELEELRTQIGDPNKELSANQRLALEQTGQEAVRTRVAEEVELALGRNDTEGARALIDENAPTLGQRNTKALKAHVEGKLNDAEIASRKQDALFLAQQGHFDAARTIAEGEDSLTGEVGVTLSDADRTHLLTTILRMEQAKNKEDARAIAESYSDDEKLQKKRRSAFEAQIGAMVSRALEDIDAGQMPELDISNIMFLAGDDMLRRYQENGLLNHESVERIVKDRARLMGELTEGMALQARAAVLMGSGRVGNPDDTDDVDAIDAHYKQRLQDEGPQNNQQILNDIVVRSGLIPKSVRSELDVSWLSTNSEQIEATNNALERWDLMTPSSVYNQLSPEAREFYQRTSVLFPRPVVEGVQEGVDTFIHQIRKDIQEAKRDPNSAIESRNRINNGRWRGDKVGETISGDPIYDGGFLEDEKILLRAMRKAADDQEWWNSETTDAFLDPLNKFITEGDRYGDPHAQSVWNLIKDNLHANFMRTDPSLGSKKQLEQASKETWKQLVGGGFIGIEEALLDEPTLTVYPTSALGPFRAPHVGLGGTNVEVKEWVHDSIDAQIIKPLDDLNIELPRDPDASFFEYVDVIAQNLNEELQTGMIPTDDPNVATKMAHRYLVAMGFAAVFQSENFQTTLTGAARLSDLMPTPGAGTREERTNALIDRNTPISLMFLPAPTGAIGLREGKPVVPYQVYVRDEDGMPHQVWEYEVVLDPETGQYRPQPTNSPLLFYPDQQDSPAVRKLAKKEQREVTVLKAKDAGVFEFAEGLTIKEHLSKADGLIEDLRADRILRRQFARELSISAASPRQPGNVAPPPATGSPDDFLEAINRVVGVE